MAPLAHAGDAEREGASRSLNSFCLLVAGVLRASLPTQELTLGWQHSIEKTRWEEHYRIVDDQLVIDGARIQAMGAGMEPPPGARLADGWWSWRPALAPLRELRITRSDYTRDYDLCWGGHCKALGALVGGARTEADVVTLRPCDAPVEQR